MEDPKEDMILVHEKRCVTLGQQLAEVSDLRPCELMCQPFPEFAFSQHSGGLRPLTRRCEAPWLQVIAWGIISE